MLFKKEGNKLYAKVNYDSLTEDGLKIFIGSIFSLTETGAYFDWGLENCGFGQFSFSFNEGKWTIMNECMGPESSYMIIKAFEDSIRASGDQKAMYCLNKIISLISYRSKSLSKSMLLIWNSAETEGGEVVNFEKTLESYKNDLVEDPKTEKNMICTKELLIKDDVTLYTMSTNHYSFTNKTGSFYEATLDLFVDVKYAKHGMIYLSQRIDLNTGTKEWIVNKNVDEKTLSKVFKMLDSSEGEHQKIWLVWKNAVKLTGGLTKMAKNIVLEAKAKDIRFAMK